MAHSVAELQAESVAYELECIDRMYLNCYAAISATGGHGVLGGLHLHRCSYLQRES